MSLTEWKAPNLANKDETLIQKAERLEGQVQLLRDALRQETTRRKAAEDERSKLIQVLSSVS